MHPFSDTVPPRLLRISFHTFRHWRATTLYHQTKDPYYVQHFLGHKKLESTEIYINIEHTLFDAGATDEFTVRVSDTRRRVNRCWNSASSTSARKIT